VTEPGAPQADPRPSGLRDPAAAARGVGAAALGSEALVLLLAVAPLLRIGGTHRGAAVVVVLVLATLAGLLTAVLRRVWAWPAGWAVPAGLLAAGWLHWSLAVLGLLLGALWGYVLHVRRVVLSGGSANG
jgi:Protein of unknown function (DUF4233)